MTSISFKQNAVAVFAMILTIWAVYSFFSWQIQPLPEKMPEKIAEKLNEKGYTGEPIFLSSQLLDKLVLNHPEFNIFPAGGNTLKNAESMKSFYILESFQSLECIRIDKKLKSEDVESSEDFLLKRCVSTNRENIITASSFLDKLTVRIGNSETPVEFKNGRFKTGASGWQKVEAGSAEFGDEHKFAIAAHPLPDKKTIDISIPSVEKKIKKIVLGAGISNSGSFKGSKAVNITASQNDLKTTIKTADGKWKELELKDFSAKEPILITISTEKSGKRHFYFDIKYTEASE